MDEYSIFRVLAALLVVVGLIALSGWLAKRSGFSKKLSSQSTVRIIGKQTLGPRASLVVIEVPGAHVVLGVTTSSINVLHTITPTPSSQSAPSSDTTFDQFLEQATQQQGSHPPINR